MALIRTGPQSVSPLGGGGGTLSGLFDDPKKQMALLTLGNMLMQANPNTQRTGQAMMQGGGALIEMQVAEQEKQAKAAAANEESLKETLFKLSASGNTDPNMFKLALEEHGVDPSSPRAKTWTQYATSKEQEQRNMAQALLGEAGGDLFDQTKLPFKDLLSVMGEKRAGMKMEQDERHHQEQLGVSRGNLDISRGNLAVAQGTLGLKQEDAQRQQELIATLSQLLGDEGMGASPAASQVSGAEGGQVIPVAGGEGLDPGQVIPVQAAPAPASAGGLTGQPKVDKLLKAGMMMAVQGETGRANALISSARVVADKSPEGRRADIRQRIDEALQAPLSPEELVKFQREGKDIPPGTSMADLMGSGALELRPNEPMPPQTQEKIMGAMHALEFGKTIQEAIDQGVKTGPIAGGFSWAKTWLGFEDETKYNEAKKQLVLAGQSVIPGIPSNYDLQTYKGTIPGWLDPPTMVQEKLKWNEKLSKQMIRTTLSYFRGSKTIIPPEIEAVAKSRGIDVNSIGSSEAEEKKMLDLDRGAKARFKQWDKGSQGDTDSILKKYGM